MLVRSQQLADLLVRGACFLAATLFVVWPLLAQGSVGVVSFIAAAPFVLAGFAPHLLGPMIGKGLMIVATLGAFYDPPNSIGFFPERFVLALPFFALALILGVPALPHALARIALKD